MQPTSAPAGVGASGAWRTPRWARGWGKIVQWSMKAWSRKLRRGDLPIPGLCQVVMAKYWFLYSVICPSSFCTHACHPGGQILRLTNTIIIPPHNEVVGGVYWFHSVRPSVRLSVRLSVRPSVRPSVPHAVSALYHLQLWMDSFHIRYKWSLSWEGVSCTMTFDLDLYLQGHLALT